MTGDRRRPALTLLHPDELVATGPVDHADWNYRPVLGFISRLRFKLIVAVLPSDIGPLLEVGYGSGVFLPELCKHSRDLYGLDIHDSADQISAILDRRGIRVDLRTGSATAMPYKAEMFNCVVSVSALEFVNDIDAATQELARVLRPDGRLVVVMPGSSPAVDFGLKLLTGKNARDEYGTRREKLLPSLLSSFTIERRVNAPSFTLGLGSLYTAMRLKRKL
ncbi:MAG TPA: class I SAM-dependent methyltransferase [Candidatus Eremiobacteraceae bacterium]|nr:class I SAM-dependent methyltransferase [Candidatus Eremiobacteraceae bacterium]